jgi:hypothetical protein
MDAKARESTPAKKKQFDVLSPNKQKFTKTDVAKYENTWMQLPHIVSLGAQKNFINFSIQLKERGTVEVDSSYFERLIAKAILFKRADKIISDQNFGGYKANIVTYTIAWLSHYTSQRIDLDRIWREQNITPAVQEAIRRVSMEVKKVLTNPANNRNITEWCKRKELETTQWSPKNHSSATRNKIHRRNDSGCRLIQYQNTTIDNISRNYRKVNV